MVSEADKDALLRTNKNISNFHSYEEVEVHNSKIHAIIESFDEKTRRLKHSDTKKRKTVDTR